MHLTATPETLTTYLVGDSRDNATNFSGAQLLRAAKIVRSLTRSQFPLTLKQLVARGATMYMKDGVAKERAAKEVVEVVAKCVASEVIGRAPGGRYQPVKRGYPALVDALRRAGVTSHEAVCTALHLDYRPDELQPYAYQEQRDLVAEILGTPASPNPTPAPEPTASQEAGEMYGLPLREVIKDLEQSTLNTAIRLDETAQEIRDELMTAIGILRSEWKAYAEKYGLPAPTFSDEKVLAPSDASGQGGES